MPGYIGELPGFYYDAEKQKYFKVEEARHAPRADSKYSVDNIKRKKRQKAAKSAEDSHEQKRLKRRGPAVACQKRPEALLLREVGYGCASSSSTIQRSWASSVVGGFRPIMLSTQNLIRHFDIAPETKDMYAILNDSRVCRLRPNFNAPVLSPEGEEDPPEFPYTYDPKFERTQINGFTIDRIADRWKYKELYNLQDEGTSINYLPQYKTLVATGRGPDPKLYVTTPEDEFGGMAGRGIQLFCNSIFRCTPRPSFSTSEHSVPAAEPIHLAIGTSGAMWVVSLDHTGAVKQKHHITGNIHILETEYLTRDLIASGSRNGEVYLTDLRTDISERRPFLQHTSPINNIRRTDSSFHIVVSGISKDIRDLSRRSISSVIPGKLCLYDIRMCKPIARPTPRFTPTSDPIVEYPFYHNDNDTELGLDVHPHLGLLAATNTWGQLHIWNLRSGELLKSFEPKEEVAGVNEVWVRSRNRVVKFMEDDGGPGGVSLWSCWKGGMARFGW